MTAPAPADLAGWRLPGGTCRVEGWESLLLHDAVRSPRSPRPHPIWAFLAPQRGMGLTLAALFEGLGCPLDVGPLLGTFGARFAGHGAQRSWTPAGSPLALDVEYEVSGGVTTVRRRTGRVLGTVDEVEVVLDLRRADGAPVLTATYGFLLPRRGVPAVGEPAPRAERPPPDPGPEHAGPSLTVREDEMKLLALLLRDPNPVHIDADAAAALGFGRACVNQGPANLAYALGFLTARQPARRSCATSTTSPTASACTTGSASTPAWRRRTSATATAGGRSPPRAARSGTPSSW